MKVAQWGYLVFTRERIVFFSGELNGKGTWRLVGPIEDQLHAMALKDKNSPVIFCITSPGGYLDSSYGFFERIILFGPKNIHTVALDDVSSAALFLYIAGKRRFVAPHTTFFIHTINTHIDEYCKNIAAACKNPNVTADLIGRLMTKKGTELAAHDALNMGLAHELLTPTDEENLRSWRDAYTTL